jgi:BolA-like protein 1
MAMSMSVVDGELSELGLTPALESTVKALKNVPDDKLRYQQLFFLASKCEPMDSAYKIDENKVPGCLSTVHIHATRRDDKIYFLGDSDAQMTKGLVAMLVNGLSGYTNEEIQRVKPEFIKYAGIANTLTPGRNNGFLNMLKVMKNKAKALAAAAAAAAATSAGEGGGASSASSSPSTGAGVAEIAASSTSGTGGPIYRSMMAKLSMLKPTELVIEDESYKHAGHAGMEGSTSTESHFNVRIIAPCFDGLSLVQRHKMVYTLLAQEMSGGVHALSIYAKTPTEEANK